MSTNYTAIEFTPLPGLVTMHGTARIGGVNQLTLTGANTIQQQQGDTYWYVVGIIAPIVAMLLIFFIWLFSLCCTRCCCKGKCGGKNAALLLFTIGCGVSFAGWILGIIASSLATNGLNSMVDGVQGATNILKDVSSTAKEAGNVTSRLVALSDAMVLQCTNNVTQFPQSSISGQLQGLTESITGQSGTGGFAGQLDSYSTDIDRYIGMVRGYIAWQSPVTISVMSVMSGIVAIFWLSTVLRVLDKTPERCHAVATCLSKVSALLIFIFAIIFMLVLWVLIAVLHFFTTAGADLCVPTPNANLNRLIGEAVGGAISVNTAGRRLTASDVDSVDLAHAEAAVSEWARRVLDAGVDPVHPALILAQAAHSFASHGRDLAYVYNKSDPCLDPAFRDQPLGQICYYQSCSGPNYLGDLTTPIRTYTNQAVQTLTNFSDNVLTLGGNFTLTCRTSITDFNQGANNVGTFIDGALDLLSCAKLNPIWAGLLYSGFCNGLVGGLIFLYTSMIIGCSSLMLATTIYLVFDFGKYRDGKLPDSWEQDGAIIAPGSAPNLGTGAPIAREVKEGP